MGRLAHAWNAFMNPDRNTQDPFKMELRTSTPTVQMPYRYQVQSNIIDTIFNQISVDVAKVSIRHIRCDYDKTYLEDLETGFNQCLTVSRQAMSSSTVSTLALRSSTKARSTSSCVSLTYSLHSSFIRNDHGNAT